MAASKQRKLARDMGVELEAVAEFYGCTTRTLSNRYNQNLPAFRAMIYGYLRVRVDDGQKKM